MDAKVLEKLDFEVLYSKAKIYFDECINNCSAENNNELIDEEIGISLKDIVAKENYVRIQFFERNKTHYILEANLSLHYPNGDEFGYYCYHQDENGEVVDDFLVFE